MRTTSVVLAQSMLSSIVRSVSIRKEAIVLTRFGKPKVAVIPIDQYELLQSVLGASAKTSAKS